MAAPTERESEVTSMEVTEQVRKDVALLKRAIDRLEVFITTGVPDMLIENERKLILDALGRLPIDPKVKVEFALEDLLMEADKIRLWRNARALYEHSVIGKVLGSWEMQSFSTKQEWYCKATDADLAGDPMEGS